MANNVTEAFGVAKDNKNQVNGGNERMISSFEGRGQGRDGIWKGYGWIIGRCGGCSNGPFFNGVDGQDFE